MTSQNNPRQTFLDNAILDEQRVRTLAALLDIHSSQSILNFGAKAQQELTNVADGMLRNVQVKDSGQAGELLSQMVFTLKGLQSAQENLKKKAGFWERLFGKSQKPILRFMQKFSTVSDQVDAISNRLEIQKQQLLMDINSLDHLYDMTLNHYRELEHFIAAGELAKRHADEVTLPALKKRVAENNTIQNAQALRDYQTQRDELERRVQDLLLTRQVAMQALPSIRLIQENDKGLVNKINTTLLNTVPLWRQQLAQSLAIHRSNEAAQALKASSDFTNELLLKNAENLQLTNREAREQIERGVFDVQAVEEANHRLIATIEESITLNKNAQQLREEAKQRLQAAEQQLKLSLMNATQQGKDRYD